MLKWDSNKTVNPLDSPLTKTMLDNFMSDMITKSLQVTKRQQLAKKFHELETAEKIKRRFAGKKIGSGCHRNVYEVKGHPDLVMKITKKGREQWFSNACEWRNFINNKDWTRLGPWLAGCMTINDSGTVLLQYKVEFRDRDKYPDKIPSVFTDTKYQNFGWIGDRFVCCDYPYFKVVGFGMRKAKWWCENAGKEEIVDEIRTAK